MLKKEIEQHRLVFTENWIYESENKFYNIQGYNVQHKCREKRAGGISIYKKENLKYNVELNKPFYKL